VAAPDALVVLTTGNAAGPLARRDLDNWNLMTPPEHLYFFDPDTIARMLENAGLAVRRITHDGLISEAGSLASRPVRVLAAALGLGNVMTVYARKTPRAALAGSRVQRFRSRVRPVARV
jgi:Methyltransferase domain